MIYSYQQARLMSSTFDSFLRHKAAYEGEGKTTVRVINQEHDLGLMIDSYATVSSEFIQLKLKEDWCCLLLSQLSDRFKFKIVVAISVWISTQ